MGIIPSLEREREREKEREREREREGEKYSQGDHKGGRVNKYQPYRFSAKFWVLKSKRRRRTYTLKRGGLNLAKRGRF